MSVEKFRHEAKRWLLQAQADIKAAEGSVTAGSFEWACFQAQQAGEKALKAIWQSHALEPWGHSLTRMIQEFPVEEAKVELASFLNHAKRLDKLYIPTRYPNGLPDSIPAEVFTLEEAREAISLAKDLIGVAREMVE